MRRPYEAPRIVASVPVDARTARLFEACMDEIMALFPLYLKLVSLAEFESNTFVGKPD